MCVRQAARFDGASDNSAWIWEDSSCFSSCATLSMGRGVGRSMLQSFWDLQRACPSHRSNRCLPLESPHLDAYRPLKKIFSFSLYTLFPVRTAGPTTRSSHSTFKFWYCNLNPAIACFYLLCGNNGTNPFVAREGSNIFPYNKCLGVSNKGLLQICWNLMYYTSCNFFTSHNFIIY